MATITAEAREARSCDRDCLRRLIARERAAYVAANPTSHELFQQAAATLLAGVPMSWMSMLTGDFPLYFQGAAATASPTWTGTPTSTSASATPAR